MEQEQLDEKEKQNLEHKINFWDRAKYASIPAALTVGACFIPNLKNTYDGLSKDKQDNYRTVALAGTTLFGTIIAVVSGYQLVKSGTAEKNNYVKTMEKR